MIPVAGSAYTYAYATLGELLAWIIGWDLVLEYAVGAATVSIGWSKTLVALLYSFGIHLPPQLLASPLEPVKLANGRQLHGIFNLPAVLIVVAVTALLISGTQESAIVNAVIVFLKVAVLVVFIVVGWRYMAPANHHPMLPPKTGDFGSFGWSGLMAGAGMIFFAYIGFDAVSTAAQETKSPQHDMPIGIIRSLLVCTVLFIAYSFVLTGVVNYRELNVAAPLALALERIPHPGLGLP